MVMEDFLKEIKYAAEGVIRVIWDEKKNLDDKHKKMVALEKAVSARYAQAQSIYDNAEDADDVMASVGMRFENYFGDDKKLYSDKQEVESISNELVVKKFSIEAASGSLLQFAKQGISIVHGSLGACPNGRGIGTQFLKEIIWQGRNQAIHWEDGNFHPPVRESFKKLNSDFGSRFADYEKMSMAFLLVETLGWVDWASFENDMKSLR